MKRHSLTSIIGKVQILSCRAVRFTSSDEGMRGVVKFDRYVTKIRRAAVNEIIRLEASETIDWQEFLTGQLKPVQP